MSGLHRKAFRRDKTPDQLHYYRFHVYIVSYPKPFSEHAIDSPYWMSEFIMLFYFVILYSYLHTVPGFRRPCMVKWSVISKWVFPQMIFLFLLRYLLAGINLCISIIGKVVLISLNKCEAQIKVRVYWFIGMTIWKEYGWIFQIAQVFISHVQNTVFCVSDVLRKCENQTLSFISLGTRKEELEWMLMILCFILWKGRHL